MRTALLTLSVCVLALPANAQYSGGTGEPNDPYQIATAADLITLGETPEDYDKHFLLTADIDLDPNLPGRKVFDRAVIAATSDISTSPYLEGTSFTGSFDGDGHTIKNLKITGGAYLGLFGRLDVPAAVSNLGLEAVEVSGTGHRVGGLVGYNGGTLVRCNSTGVVNGTGVVGGLVGCNDWGSITASYSTGSVSGTGNSVGGLVGHNGIQSSISYSYSIGSVSGNDSVGGLVGGNSGNYDMWGGGSITASYSSSSVSGTGNSVGGLVGSDGGLWGGGSITSSYSSGSVSGTGNSVGGLVGSSVGGNILSSFWDIQTSTTLDGVGYFHFGTGGVAGKTTAEMQTAETFLEAGWDFVGETANGTADIWAEPEGGGYPILWWQLPEGYGLPVFSGGTGERDDPYGISRADELNRIGHNPRLMKCHFKLVANVDLSGLHFYPIGSPEFPYMGVFDGNGHTVCHLTITGGRDLGLFGYLAAEAKVRNLGVVDVNITGYGNVGGLAGYNAGSISECHSSASVNGGLYHVGGLVGYNAGSINSSYSSCSVNGTGGIPGYVEYVGGLAGYNAGRIVGCHSRGLVSGTAAVVVGGLVGCNDWGGSINSSYSSCSVNGTGGRLGYAECVGGLAGSNRGSIATSYSTGSVTGTDWRVGGFVGYRNGGSISSSFWDTDMSSLTTSYGGTGKTTAEMQTAATFLDAGWDFLGETANGTEDIWWILEGKDYPRLWWEALGIDE